MAMNHLAGQTSPYLLQHVHNPVDWYPWGPEALARARDENKPIFLSVGYAACHWCHVMERESFENGEIADFLNRHFVSIKVDREERPDIDEIYMRAVQLLTRSGGWPMNVFLTPALAPFFGGTYFPPRDAYGRPGFLSVLRKVEETWRTRRDGVEQAGRDLASAVAAISAGPEGGGDGSPVGRVELARAVAEIVRSFDDRWGGFGGAPKFPPHGAIALLLREHHRTGEAVPLRLAEHTLERMALGGIYDQVGGGFARYSVDERWLVPHFEKMLYDQALLVPVYVDAWLVTRKPLYRRVVEQTLDFVRREMTDPAGGFFSSLDADSEGVEGKFYVWSPAEVREALGDEDGRLFSRVFGITEQGNFEGESIPNLLGGSLEEQAAAMDLSESDLVERLAPLTRRMLAARSRRVRPATDDKVLTAWNGLMITACCRAYQAFGRDSDRRSAEDAARFVLDRLRPEKRLRVSYRDGRAHLNAYLDDHAFMVRGLVDLHESSFERVHLDTALEIARDMLARFEDRARGGFFFTSDDHEPLLVRTKSHHDGAIPAGSGVASEALLRLGRHLDSPELTAAAVRTLAAYRPMAEQAPSAFASLLVAADLAAEPGAQIAIVAEGRGPDADALLAKVRERYLPNRVVGLSLSGDDTRGLPLLAGKKAVEGRATAYLCRDYACDAPTTDPAALERLLDPSRSR